MHKEKWWERKDAAYELIVGNVRQLFETQMYKTDRNLMHLRLYGNHYITGFSGTDFVRTDVYNEERLVLNVCASVVDAATAKISSNRPRPMYVTEGGNWKLQQQGKALTQFIDGQFHHCKVYPTTRKSFKDAAIFGDGPAHVYTDWRDKENPIPRVERVLPEEIWVDALDGKNGAPRQLYRIKTIGREVVMFDPAFKKYRASVSSAGMIEKEDMIGTVGDSLADPITLIEAWHLPSGPGASDGRRVMCCSTTDLVNTEWTRERFPFPKMVWNPSVIGYESQGAIEQIKGIQIEINKILRKVQQHMHLAGSFILANRSSKIVKGHLKNTPWTLLEHTGDAPTFATVQSISPEYFAQLDRLYAKAFEIAGITQLFAMGKKPSGLDSGKALREYKDTESERFMNIGQQFEEFHLDIAECLIDEAKDIDEYLQEHGNKDGYTVLAKGDEESWDGGNLKRLKWSDVNLDRDKYIMQAYPTSFLPKLPAFRLQTVKDMLEAIPETQPYAMKLLDYPDLKSITRRITAPIDDIERNICNMLYGEAETEEEYEELYNPPDAFTDLPKALQIAKGEYLKAKIDGAPEERLELLRRYMTSAEEQMRPPEPEMPEEGLGGPEMGAQLPPGVTPGPGMPGVAPGVGGNVNIDPRITVEAPAAPMPIPGR
jgi:hypothetical protein